jgi:hypothetical protein
MEHKLFNQLMEANASDDEIAELYEDLRCIFNTPFDELINKALNERGCVYIELCQPLAN